MQLQQIWNIVFRVAGAALCCTAIVFLSVPRDSIWKELSGVASAFFGLVCIVAIRYVRRPGAENELQMVNQELRRHPIDFDHDDAHAHVDHDFDIK